jgi:hypothetical protein
VQTVNFSLQSGSTLSWVAPFDCEIVGSSGSAAAIVSTDPALTYSGVTTPVADGVEMFDLVFAGQYLAGIGMKVPKGTTLYVAPSGTGLYQLFINVLV